MIMDEMAKDVAEKVRALALRPRPAQAILRASCVAIGSLKGFSAGQTVMLIERAQSVYDGNPEKG